MATERHEGRIKISLEGSLEELGAKLEELVRAASGLGLAVEACDVDNEGQEEIYPLRVQPDDLIPPGPRRVTESRLQ